jgi:hypothetical protein
MDWKQLLACITGIVDQKSLLHNAYLVTENRILCNQLQGRVRLSDGECQCLAENGTKLGRFALEEIATSVKSDTRLAWHRTWIAQKCNGSRQRNAPGRPPIDAEQETRVVHLAQESRSWGFAIPGIHHQRPDRPHRPHGMEADLYREVSAVQLEVNDVSYGIYWHRAQSLHGNGPNP